MTLTDREWVRKIVDHIDEVGWCTGATKKSSGRVCLIGGGVEVTTGVSMESEDEDSFDIEEQIAARLFVALNVASSFRDPWTAVSRYNDDFGDWEDLKKDVLGRIS